MLTTDMNGGKTNLEDITLEQKGTFCSIFCF